MGRFVNWLKSHKLISIIFLLILIGGGFFAYLKLKPKTYQTTTVSRHQLTQLVEASGEIDAEEKVDLHFQALGKLNWIGVKTGDEVKKWQIVATQDPRSIEKNLKKELIAFEKEFRENDQARENWELDRRRSILRLFDTAQGDLNSAVLDVEIRNLSLELSRLVSPITGIVTAIDTPIAGVNVTATDGIEIVNPETLYFSAEIDEADIALIKESQTSTITLDAYENEPFTTTITRIDFSATTSDSGSTVFLVRLSLPQNDALKFRLGMNGEVAIAVAQKDDALAVPIEATKTTNDTTTVKVLKDNQPEEREIKTGIVTDDFIEVLSGIEEGDVIITGD